MTSIGGTLPSFDALPVRSACLWGTNWLRSEQFSTVGVTAGLRDGVTDGAVSSNLDGMPQKWAAMTRLSAVDPAGVPGALPSGRTAAHTGGRPAVRGPGRSGGCRGAGLNTAGLDRKRSAGLDRKSQDLLTFPFGQAAPDSVRLVNLQGVGPARGQRRALEADGLGGRLASRTRRPPFALGVEEVGTGHASAGGVQLPIPHIGIRSGKTPGISHRDAHLRRSPSSTFAVRASTVQWVRRSAGTQSRSGRIRIDIDAAVILTLGPNAHRIKSGSSFDQDRLQPAGTLQTRLFVPSGQLAQGVDTPDDRSLAVMNGWSFSPNRGLRARSVVTIEYRPDKMTYVERQHSYTLSKLSFFVSRFARMCPNSELRQSSNGRHSVEEALHLPELSAPARAITTKDHAKPAVRPVAGDDLERRLT